MLVRHGLVSRLGQIYKAAGVEARASAMFRRVLEFKPRHAGALAELGRKR